MVLNTFLGGGGGGFQSIIPLWLAVGGVAFSILVAVISALEKLNQSCIVELYSDSKYVIDALTKGWLTSWIKNGWRKADKKPVLNVDLWQRLLPLLEKHEMHYHWVKGHAENEKNNRCDQMAVAESKKF